MKPEFPVILQYKLFDVMLDVGQGKFSNFEGWLARVVSIEKLESEIKNEMERIVHWHLWPSISPGEIMGLYAIPPCGNYTGRAETAPELSQSEITFLYI